MCLMHVLEEECDWVCASELLSPNCYSRSPECFHLKTGGQDAILNNTNNFDFEEHMELAEIDGPRNCQTSLLLFLKIKLILHFPKLH